MSNKPQAPVYHAGTRYLRNRNTGMIFIGCPVSKPKLAAHPDIEVYVPPVSAPRPAPTVAIPLPAPVAEPVTEAPSDGELLPLHMVPASAIRSLKGHQVKAYLDAAGIEYDESDKFMALKSKLNKLYKEVTGG